MLDGRHALVTGGGTGIGLAIAQALAEAGAQVTISGRRAEILEEAAGDTLFPQVMDVADEASVTEGVARAVAARGPVEICVANAGIAEGKSIAKTDLSFWRNMMAINLDGTFLTFRECLKSMQDAEWGRIIGISSIAGVKGLKGAPCYSASKHGMIGLIRGLAADYARKPITCNAICPAYVETDIIDRNIASIMARTGFDEDKARALMVDVNPHGRLITPDEVANAVLWLCSPGSDSVNGQAIQVAGGEF